MVNDPLKISHAAYDNAMAHCRTLTGRARVECIKKAHKLRPDGGV